MKIVKSCGNEAEIKSGLPLPRLISQGTIFRYDSLVSGPYLKVPGGFVDFYESRYYPDTSFPTKFGNYVELKDAYLVTGEK